MLFSLLSLGIEPQGSTLADEISPLQSLTLLSVEMTNKMSSRATPRDLNRMDNRKRFLRYGLREGEMTIVGAFSLLDIGLPSAITLHNDISTNGNDIHCRE